MLGQRWIGLPLFLLMGSLSLAAGGPGLSLFKDQLVVSPLIGKALEDYTGKPYHSTLEIRGKISMGSTAYFSVTPELSDSLRMQVLGTWLEILQTWAASLSPMEQQLLQQSLSGKDLFAYGVRPQLKVNEAQGYSLYFHIYTGHPKLMEEFKKISQVKFAMPDLVIKYSESGPSQKLFSKTPAAGSTVTKPLGPFQPK